MADDRLDDAIDAVVRAVDRIERATRRQVTTGEHPVDVPAADGEADGDGEPLTDVLPPQDRVAPGRGAWQPASDASDERPRKKSKKKKHGHAARRAVAEPAVPTLEPNDLDDAEFAEFADDTELAAPPSHAPAEPAALSGHAQAEVLELVGRIVARTQELDDHLEAARALRGEITELVARLAAASTQPR